MAHSTPTETPTLRVELADRRQLLFDTLIDTINGGLYCRSPVELAIGEPVVLDLRLPVLPDGVRLAGAVRWRRPPAPPDVPDWGLGVEFAASQWRKRDFLVELAMGLLARQRVSSRRLPVRMPAELYLQDGDEQAGEVGELPVPQRGYTRDVGRGGVFLAELSGVLPAVGTRVAVALELPPWLEAPPAAPPLRFRGQVAWRGRDVDGEGVGIGFLFRSDAERSSLEQVVSRLEDRIAG